MNGDADSPAALLEAHFIGKRPDQVQTASVITMHIARHARIRDGIGIESIPLVLHADVDPMVADIDVNPHFLSPIELIAVLRGVYNDLIDKQFGPVCLVIFPIEVLGGKRVGLADQLIEPGSGATRGDLQTL